MRTLGAGQRTDQEVADRFMDNILFSTVIFQFLSVLIVGSFLKLREKNLPRLIDKVNINWEKCIYCILSVFSCSFAFNLITYDLTYQNNEQFKESAEYFERIQPGLGGILWAAVLLIFAPIAEDFLFLICNFDKVSRIIIIVDCIVIYIGCLRLLLKEDILRKGKKESA